VISQEKERIAAEETSSVLSNDSQMLLRFPDIYLCLRQKSLK